MMESVEQYMRDIICSLGEKRVEVLYEKLPQGKKLRSKLILNIASQVKEAPKLAAIIELIHLASLLHDDVIDESDIRRGKPSVNAVFGDKTAIMLGDILYSKAFYELTSFDEKIAKIVSDGVSKLSIGELLDVEMSHYFNSNKEKYFDMIYKKTASLIEASAASAAILAQKEHRKFATYGENLGLAFQIVDDILDITQESETLGKPSLSDFREGKTTLPYIYMYEKLDKTEQERLIDMFGRDLSENESLWIKGKLEKTGALERSIEKANEFGDIAKASIKNENVPKLDDVVTQMIKRNF